MKDPKFLKPGESQHEEYYSKISKKTLYQWDYRRLDGELYSGVEKSLDKVNEKIRNIEGNE